MSPLEALVLGLIQGVTEFLPISSSAHLILTSRWLGWRDQGLAFDVCAHVGSLAAVISYLRHDLARLGSAGLDSLAARHRGAPPADPAGARLCRDLLLATVPVALAGLAFQGLVATAARSALVVAVTSIGFGLLLALADRSVRATSDLERLGLGRALVVGAAQALALVPGTSRSGVTITAGLFLGLSREDATRFSFLLAVPVGLLVAAKQLLDLVTEGAPPVGWTALAVGFAVSAVSAYLAIGWLLGWVRRQSMTVFVIYRVALGLVILALLAG